MLMTVLNSYRGELMKNNLQAQLIDLLGLEWTKNNQLIPKNLEDFQSDWRFTVDRIMELIENKKSTEDVSKVGAAVDDNSSITELREAIGKVYEESRTQARLRVGSPKKLMLDKTMQLIQAHQTALIDKIIAALPEPDNYGNGYGDLIHMDEVIAVLESMR